MRIAMFALLSGWSPSRELIEKVSAKECSPSPSSTDDFTYNHHIGQLLREIAKSHLHFSSVQPSRSGGERQFYNRISFGDYSQLRSWIASMTRWIFFSMSLRSHFFFFVSSWAESVLYPIWFAERNLFLKPLRRRRRTRRNGSDPIDMGWSINLISRHHLHRPVIGCFELI